MCTKQSISKRDHNFLFFFSLLEIHFLQYIETRLHILCTGEEREIE